MMMKRLRHSLQGKSMDETFTAKIQHQNMWWSDHDLIIFEMSITEYATCTSALFLSRTQFISDFTQFIKISLKAVLDVYDCATYSSRVIVDHE